MNKKMWIIQNPDGEVYWDTRYCTRAESIAVFMIHMNFKSWKQAYRKGYRCKKVRLVEGWELLTTK